MNPAEALTLEKCYKAERRRARSTGSDNAPRKSAKQELSGSSGTVGQTWPQFPPGRQISVLFSTRWVEGVIAKTDGSVITVVYDDGEERAHDAAELTAYKLLAESTGAPTGALMVMCPVPNVAPPDRRPERQNLLLQVQSASSRVVSTKRRAAACPPTSRRRSCCGSRWFCRTSSTYCCIWIFRRFSGRR